MHTMPKIHATNLFRTLNSTFVQCIAGSRERRATGPVAVSIDNGAAESEGDFTYTDDPQVFSLRNNKMIERYIIQNW